MRKGRLESHRHRRWARRVLAGVLMVAGTSCTRVAWDPLDARLEDEHSPGGTPELPEPLPDVADRLGSADGGSTDGSVGTPDGYGDVHGTDSTAFPDGHDDVQEPTVTCEDGTLIEVELEPSSVPPDAVVDHDVPVPAVFSSAPLVNGKAVLGCATAPREHVFGVRWAGESSTVGSSCIVPAGEEARPARGMPLVTIGGRPVTVILSGGSGAHPCLFRFATHPGPDLVVAPGTNELWFAGAYLGNHPCALFVSDAMAWAGGRAAPLDPDGYYRFRFGDIGGLPAGLWRFNYVRPETPCSSAAFGTVDLSAPVAGGPWPADPTAASPLAQAWAWSGLDPPTGKVTKAYRMLVLPGGAILPAGSNPSGTAATVTHHFCPDAEASSCSAGTCGSVGAACRAHPFPRPTIAGDDAAWTGSARHPCVPGSWQAEVCTNGIDEDCSGAADDGCASLVANGDFEAASAPWQFEPPAAVERQEAAAVHGTHGVSIANAAASNADWSRQIKQAIPGIEAGRWYRASFWARAPGGPARTLTVSLEDPADGYKGAGLYVHVDLSAEWQRFTLPFVALRSGTMQLAFSTGWSAGTVELDLISLSCVSTPGSDCGP